MNDQDMTLEKYTQDQDRAWEKYMKTDMHGSERDIFEAGWRAALLQLLKESE